MTVPQASTGAEVENQLWDNESENTADMPTDVSTGDDSYQQDNSWGEGGVDLMSLMEPPPLPDFDDR